jgi:hypothetical protein
MYKYGEKRHWPYAVAAVLLLTLFLSLEKHSRLRETPPPDFVSSAAGATAVPEPELARSYWNCARNVIQYKYHFGTMLPSEPPPEFILPQGGPAGLTPDARKRARIRYWENLRKVWLLPDTWDHSYRLDFAWFFNGIERLKSGRLPKFKGLDD